MPKIAVKNLQQKTFPVDYDDSTTVLNLKEKLRAEPHKVQGEPADMRLIYSGKILADDTKLLSSFNFKDKDFLVLMVSKPKAAPAASSSSSASAPAPAAVPSTPAASAAAPVTAPNAPAPAQAQAATPAAPVAEGQGSNDDGTGFATGSALQTSIAEMVNMGFPREQVMRAMRASFNNPHRAVDYLMNGIPDHLNAEIGGSQGQAGTPAPAAGARGTPVPETPASPSPAGGNAGSLGAATPAPAAAAAAAAPAPAAGGAGNLFEQAAAAQAQNQQAAQGAAGGLGGGGSRAQMLAQIRQIAQTNPAALGHLLGPLIQQNPELASVDPQTLLQHLAQAGDGDDDDDDDMMGGLDPDNVVEVQLTAEEQEQLQGIESMGFTRQQALQAYLAADRNPDNAVNLLLSGAFADDEAPQQ